MPNYRNVLDSLFATTPDYVHFKDKEGRFLRINPALASRLGLKDPRDAEGKSDRDFFPPDFVAQAGEDDRQTLATGESLVGRDEYVRWPDGVASWISTVKVVLRDDSGEIIGIAGLSRDITKRKQSEKDLKKRDALLAGAAEVSKTLLAEKSLEKAISSSLAIIGQAADQDRAYIFEVHKHPVTGRTVISQRYEWVKPGIPSQLSNPLMQNMLFDTDNSSWYDPLNRGDPIQGVARDFMETDRAILESQGIVSILVVPVMNGGTLWGLIGFDNCHLEYVWSRSEYSILATTATAIGAAVARREAEEEQDKLQAILSHSQKMESVGRLAGGVAHDFNNMLQVILGYVEIVIEKNGDEGVLRDDLEQIRKAAQRSTDLTRQLLAFARKQTIAPKVLDLNEFVPGLIKMMRRLIGEAIDLEWIPGKGAMKVRMDPSQVDQIFANLCVNARDAIGGVGRITIETREAVVDKTSRALINGAVPGHYVALSVRDTGCGMDKDTLNHIFEPFFTTKRAGAGTGLGLASVYGIVKQNGGYVDVESEPGKGSAFTILLPQHEGEIMSRGDPVHVALRGTETVLLVEDEPSVAAVGKVFLERAGFVVKVANSAEKALRLASEHQGGIDLLLTDVMMPKMSGPELAGQIIALRPGIKTLFVSGYSDNIITASGTDDQKANFLAKPFSCNQLVCKAREVLDR